MWPHTACYGHVHEMRHSRAFPLLVLLLGNIGCSFIAIHPSPRWDAAAGKSECASAAWVAADGVAAGVALLVAVGLNALNNEPRAFNDQCTPATCPQSPSLSPGIYLPAAILGASALYGGIATATCHSQPLARNPDAPTISIPDEPRSRPRAAPPAAATPSADVGNSPPPSAQSPEPAPAAPPPDERW
jgi:hypothetical protein